MAPDHLVAGCQLVAWVKSGSDDVSLSRPRYGDSWLFPGQCPGQHISADQLGQRLIALGIQSDTAPLHSPIHPRRRAVGRGPGPHTRYPHQLAVNGNKPHRAFGPPTPPISDLGGDSPACAGTTLVDLACYDKRGRFSFTFECRGWCHCSLLPLVLRDLSTRLRSWRRRCQRLSMLTGMPGLCRPCLRGWGAVA
jgi:hypothetical protein